MNVLNPYVKQYKKNEIETATPEEILILLYNAAINFLNKSKVSLEHNDDELFRHNILSCRNIILEFMNTLDMEKGGNVAQTLYNLYRYYHKILIKVEITKNIDGIDEVLRHLTSLRDTWKKAIEIAKAEKESLLIDKYEPAKNEEYDDNDNDDDNDDDDDDTDEAL
jgi:flagellar secretion chaperone FliS